MAKHTTLGAVTTNTGTFLTQQYHESNQLQTDDITEIIGPPIVVVDTIGGEH
jgi:hypothetical protein